jgi:hypothetical protein
MRLGEGGEHQHGKVVAKIPEALEQLGTGLLGQHLVEHEQIGALAPEGVLEFPGAEEGANLPPITAQTLPEEFAQDFVVIKDPDP